jgi:hypothetical protein
MTDKYGATPTGVGAICTRPLTARMSILWPSLSPLRLQALNLPHHTLDAAIHKVAGVWEPPAAQRTLIRCICTGLRSESLRCAWPSVWAREILVLFPPVRVPRSRSVNVRERIGRAYECTCRGKTARNTQRYLCAVQNRRCHCVSAPAAEKNFLYKHDLRPRQAAAATADKLMCGGPLFMCAREEKVGA